MSKTASVNKRVKRRSLFTQCFLCNVGNCSDCEEESTDDDGPALFSQQPSANSKDTSVLGDEPSKAVGVLLNIPSESSYNRLPYECTASSQISYTKSESITDIVQRHKTEKVVRMILGKYLEAKIAEERQRSRIHPASSAPRNNNKQQAEDVVELVVNELSSSSSETIHLDSSDLSNTDLLPIKSKSAPTNSETFDNFPYAGRPRTQRLSDSCIDLEDDGKSKRQLELIFTKSCDDLARDYEETIGGGLPYKITCEGTPVITGSLDTEAGAVMHSNRRMEENGRLSGNAEKMFLEEESELESEVSLKWRLIISPHKSTNNKFYQ